MSEPLPAGVALEVLIDEIYDAHQELKAHRAEEKKIKERIDELEASLMAQMGDVGLTRAGSNRANAIIQESEVPSIKDWDACLEFLIANDMLFFLQRSINQAPYRDLIATGEAIPGVEPFTRRKLSITKIGK